METWPDGEEFGDLHLDADDFLAEIQDKLEEEQEDYRAIEEFTITTEERVLATLEILGFPSGQIRALQLDLAPNRPLMYSINQMFHLRDQLSLDRAKRDIDIMNEKLNLMSAIQGIAGYSTEIEGEIDEATLAENKREQQLAIYANDGLHPKYKELFLAAIEKMYPGIEGLPSDEGERALAVTAYRDIEIAKQEISERMITFYEKADAAFWRATATLGLGQHDMLSTVAKRLIAQLCRMHVLETGGYSHDVREYYKDENLLLSWHRQDALAIGWTDEEFEEVVEQINESLQETDEA